LSELLDYAASKLDCGPEEPSVLPSKGHAFYETGKKFDKKTGEQVHGKGEILHRYEYDDAS